MASDRDDAWQVGVAAPALDLTVAPGDAPTAIRELTALTGRNPVPPEWALGPGISRAVQTIGGTAEVYEQQVRSDLEAVARYDLPLEHFAIEGWPMLEERGVLDEIHQRMRDLDLHPISYYKAFVGGSAHTERDRVFDEAIDGGHVATTATGEPYLFGSPVEIHKPAALIDVTDPDAVAWYRDRILEGLEMGFDGFMQDFGEESFVDMHFADGSTGEQMHNRYPVRTGMPIARPLWLHHPDDPEARIQDQQWLLGPDVLVAPVVEEDATEREVYFPDGCWEHAERDDRHQGPGYETVEAPLEVLPYYVRCGTDPFAAAAASHQPATTTSSAAADGRSLPTTGGTAGGLGALALLTVGAIRRRRVVTPPVDGAAGTPGSWLGGGG